MINYSTYLNEGDRTLPNQFKAKSGSIVNPAQDIWVISDGVKTARFTFSSIDASDDFLWSLKSALIWYLENQSVSHARNLFGRFNAFAKFLNRKITSITSLDIINYRAALSERNQWYLGALSGFFRRWHEMLLPGLNDDVVQIFNELRIRGNIKGEAVLTMNPETGPYTDLEMQAIHLELSRRHKNQKITDEDYCLAWFFIAFGMRPIQYAGMKVKDVWSATEKDGSEVYVIRMPRAKQRVSPRTLFLERKLAPEIGHVLEGHIKAIMSAFKGKLADANELPLFPRNKSGIGIPGFEYHLSTEMVAERIKRIIGSLNVVSERTGKKLKVSATRFRRTIGTRAAEEGHGPLLIAEILDHKDTQNVGVYIEGTPAIVKRIDKAVALKLGPMAQAFKGILINSETDAVRSDDKSSRICGPQQVGDFRPVGSCGSYGFCGSFAPIACYTCQNFQPWADAPHEKVLEHLISERERLLGSSGSRIAAINDQTILAVAQVVATCKKQLAHENG